MFVRLTRGNIAQKYSLSFSIRLYIGAAPGENVKTAQRRASLTKAMVIAPSRYALVDKSSE
jgi:hypothetical protein